MKIKDKRTGRMPHTVEEIYSLKPHAVFELVEKSGCLMTILRPPPKPKSKGGPWQRKDMFALFSFEDNTIHWVTRECEIYTADVELVIHDYTGGE